MYKVFMKKQWKRRVVNDERMRVRRERAICACFVKYSCRVNENWIIGHISVMTEDRFFAYIFFVMLNVVLFVYMFIHFCLLLSRERWKSTSELSKCRFQCDVEVHRGIPGVHSIRNMSVTKVDVDSTFFSFLLIFPLSKNITVGCHRIIIYRQGINWKELLTQIIKFCKIPLNILVSCHGIRM